MGDLSRTTTFQGEHWHWHWLALTQAVGLDSELKTTLRAICRVQESACVVALHGIDAGGTCTPLVSGRGVSERTIAQY